MKILVILVIVLISLIFISCVKPHVDKPSFDYPYISQGVNIYPDQKSLQLSNSTSLVEVFNASYFASLPEVEESLKLNGFILVGDQELTIQGDGGFFGLRLLKTKDFPSEIIIIIPDYEKKHKMRLSRVTNGWKVVESNLL